MNPDVRAHIDEHLKPLNKGLWHWKEPLDPTTRPVLICAPEGLPELASALKEISALSFEILESISGLDRGGAQELEVWYHFCSVIHRRQLAVQVLLSATENGSLILPSIAGVYRAADWHEREVFDLFGIEFKGHPNLKRILLPDDWEGHPLRKNYKAAESWHGIPIPYHKAQPPQDLKDLSKK